MTKQLNSVTRRPLPAPAMIRPAGMKRKSAIAARKRASHSAGSASGCASAFATRRQVSAISRSTGVPSACRSRYFCSQMNVAMGASVSGATGRLAADGWSRAGMVGLHG